MKFTLRILLFISLGLYSSLSLADKKDEKWNPLVEFYLAHEAGTFEFEDKTDSGSYDAMGVGFRGGYNFPYLFLGGEAYYSVPRYAGHQSLDSATRELYPLADSYALNYGGTAIIKLGALSLIGTIYFESKLNGTIENTDPFGEDGDYEYHGVGSRFAVELRLVKGLAIGVGFFHYSYDQYSLDKDVNTLTKADKADRPKLTLDGTSFTINYNIPIDFGK